MVYCLLCPRICPLQRSCNTRLYFDSKRKRLANLLKRLDRSATPRFVEVRAGVSSSGEINTIASYSTTPAPFQSRPSYTYCQSVFPTVVATTRTFVTDGPSEQSGCCVPSPCQWGRRGDHQFLFRGGGHVSLYQLP